MSSSSFSASLPCVERDLGRRCPSSSGSKPGIGPGRGVHHDERLDPLRRRAARSGARPSRPSSGRAAGTGRARPRRRPASVSAASRSSEYAAASVGLVARAVATVVEDHDACGRARAPARGRRSPPSRRRSRARAAGPDPSPATSTASPTPSSVVIRMPHMLARNRPDRATRRTVASRSRPAARRLDRDAGVDRRSSCADRAGVEGSRCGSS